MNERIALSSIKPNQKILFEEDVISCFEKVTDVVDTLYGRINHIESQRDEAIDKNLMYEATIQVMEEEEEEKSIKIKELTDKLDKFESDKSKTVKRGGNSMDEMLRKIIKEKNDYLANRKGLSKKELDEKRTNYLALIRNKRKANNNTNNIN